MSIIVLVRFPMSIEKVSELASQYDIDWDAVARATERAGGRNYHQISRPDEFIDIDEYPSREAYAQFKAEAGPVINEFERLVGVTSTEEFWEVADRRGA